MNDFHISTFRAPLFIHIAAGVAIGCTVAAIVVWALWQWQIRLASEQLAAEFQQSTQRAQAEQKARADAAARAAAEARNLEAQAQRADELARRQAQDAKEQREIAWARYYRKPAHCDEARGGSWSVDCANHFMRAKKAFDEAHPR